MEVPQQTLSLRERKRLQTWNTIHEVAVSLVEEQGWACTTVDMIASHAGVSTRTFFNYFPSKEDAVLGIRELVVPPQAIEEFHADTSNLLDRTVRLIRQVLGTAFTGSRNTQQRLTLVKSVPELRHRYRSIGPLAAHAVKPILLEVVAENYPGEFDPQDYTQALLMVAGSLISFAFHDDPLALATTPEAQLDHASKIFREVMINSL